MSINFIKVTNENRSNATALSVVENQRNMIEPVADCLKESDELSLWKPYVIAENETLIGFFMYGLWENEGENGRLWLDRFLIDKHFQGKGYAKKCLPMIIEKLKNEYETDKIYLSVYENNLPAISLYKAIGFEFNGELDAKGELVMCILI